MKSKNYIYWKGWMLVIFILILTLFVINFLLPLPALFPIVADEDAWFENLSNGTFTIIAAIVGSLLNKQYRDKEIDKENQRTIIQNEINRLTTRYDALTDIIKENASILNFENRQNNLLSQIDPSTTNMELIKNISEYQQQITDTQQKLAIFFNKGETSEECRNYENHVQILANTYCKVLNGFLSYLNKTDSVHNTMKTSDYLAPLINQTDKAMITAKKIESVNIFQENKDNFLKIQKQQKTNMDKMKIGLDYYSKALLEYEYNKIQKKNNILKSL